MNKLQGRKQKSVKILHWLGWGIVYLFAFYLGNLAGEYTAAHIPIGSFSLPSKFPISLPRVSVAWNGWKALGLSQNSSVIVPSTTKPVVIAGQFFAVPLEGASPQEKEAFIASVRSLAVPSFQWELSPTCEIQPPFGLVHQKDFIRIINGSKQTRSIRVETKTEPISIVAGATTTIDLDSNPGVYGIFCDETPAGYFVVSSQ